MSSQITKAYAKQIKQLKGNMEFPDKNNEEHCDENTFTSSSRI